MASRAIVGLGRASGIVVAVVAIAAAIGTTTLARPAGAEEPPRLLLLPVVVHSAEPPDYVRDGLADMLASRFGRIGGLELERVEDPEKATSSLAEAIEAGRAANADYVLFGSFTRFGKGASLDVQCVPVSGRPRQEPLREIFVHSGSIGEIIPDLDELAGKVSRFVRGEAVAGSPAPASAGGGAAAIGAAPIGGGASEEGDLIERIERLEATVAELLEAQGASPLEE